MKYQNRENEPGQFQACRRRALALTAAGLAGLLGFTYQAQAAAVPGGSAISGDPGARQSADVERQIPSQSTVGKGQGFLPGVVMIGQAPAQGAAAKWDEERILRNWDLDPDELPEVPEEELPRIPEELIPYFQEETEGVLAWYAGRTPPAADLGKYSPRADAVRAAVREAARRAARRERRELDPLLRGAIASLGEEALPEMLAKLQGDADPGTHPLLATQAYGAEPTAIASAASDGYVPSEASGSQYQQAYGETGGLTTVPAGQIPAVQGVPGEISEESGALPYGQEAGEGTTSGLYSLHRYLEARRHTQEEYAPAPAAEEGFDSAAGSGAFAGILPGTDAAGLPVPPCLCDFALRFPADPSAMKTAGGMTLFPGLSNYVGMQDALDSCLVQAEVSESGLAVSDIVQTEAPESGLAVSDIAQAEIPGSGPAVSESDGRVPEEDAFQADGFAEGPSFSMQELSGVDAALPDRVPFLQRAETQQRRTVFIGDSRTVGMRIYVGGEEHETWSAKNSMGYSWMVSTGVPAVEDQIGRDTDVVILMGVNDLGNMGSYVRYMNEKAAEWNARGARTFFVSVTPVRENGSHNARNFRIEEFNAYAQANLRGVHYIDAYSRIRDSFGSPDGLHYDGRTYWEIYKIIRFHLYRGWYQEAGLWFYFDCGKPQTGWQFVDGRWQYMDGLGVRWVKDGRVGDVCLAPYPEEGILDPYRSVTMR